jgi:hypothetical protein
MVKNFTSRRSIGRICNDQLLSSGLKSYEDKDDQTEMWLYVQEGKGSDLNE